MKELMAFLKGYKPAIMLSSGKVPLMASKRRGSNSNIAEPRVPVVTRTLLSKGYFFTELIPQATIIFFQNKELKEYFDSHLTSTIIDGVEYSIVSQYYLGLALGYPPKAVEWFREKELDRSLYRFVDFYGIKFTCRVDMVDDCINWCNKNYKIPSGVESFGITVAQHPKYKNQGAM